MNVILLQARQTDVSYLITSLAEANIKQKTKEQSLQSAEQISSVPPWWGGQQWPQHHRTPHFHAGKAGAHCGEKRAGAPSKKMGYTDRIMESTN